MTTGGDRAEGAAAADRYPHWYTLHETGVPHEHDEWFCDCGAWWYEGGCEICGPEPDPEPNPCPAAMAREGVYR